MAEWLGSLIANLPPWVAIVVVALGVIVWGASDVFALGPWSHEKYEWPEDKKKRLQKAEKKARKG